MSRHTVRVVRIRFESAIVEVDIFDDKSTEEIVRAKALGWAEGLPDDEWHLEPFSVAKYAPFVECSLTEGDHSDIDVSDPDALPNAVNDLSKELRYSLLSADLSAGEGSLVIQPWFYRECDSLLKVDIAKDWAGQTEQLLDRMGEI